jgi:hypothetical protein
MDLSYARAACEHAKRAVVAWVPIHSPFIAASGRPPFLLAHPAPDTVHLMRPHRERQAFGAYRASRADFLRLGDLVQGRAGRRQREEKIRIRRLAGRS